MRFGPPANPFPKGNQLGSKGNRKTRTSPTEFVKKFLFENKEGYKKILMKAMEQAEKGDKEARRDVLSFMPRSA